MMRAEQWESILFKLNDSKRFRRIVGSVAGSCLTAATPSLASMNQAACLIALDIVQDGIATLNKVEEAYRHEKKAKETIEEVIRSYSLYQLEDTLDAAEDGADENRLLPATNKLWPFMVTCVKNKNPVVLIHIFCFEYDMETSVLITINCSFECIIYNKLHSHSVVYLCFLICLTS